MTGVPDSVAPFINIYGPDSSTTLIANFGQRPFAYSAPTNYKAVCTTNFADLSFDDGTHAFKPTAYAGTGSAISISTPFEPDLVWTKRRDATSGHVLQDRVNGITSNYLQTQATDQLQAGTQGVTGTSTTGYTIGTGSGVNGSSKTFVSLGLGRWTRNSTSNNTVGARTSTVKASTASGISIVSWTGNGNGGTVGHSLGVSLRSSLLTKPAAVAVSGLATLKMVARVNIFT